jgi:hypothetical protein
MSAHAFPLRPLREHVAHPGYGASAGWTTRGRPVVRRAVFPVPRASSSCLVPGAVQCPDCCVLSAGCVLRCAACRPARQLSGRSARPCGGDRARIRRREKAMGIRGWGPDARSSGVGARVTRPPVAIAAPTGRRNPASQSVCSTAVRAHCMNPRSGDAKFPRFGNAQDRSACDAPNHLPSVAPNCAVEIVGIHTPRLLASSGPPSAKVGT